MFFRIATLRMTNTEVLSNSNSDAIKKWIPPERLPRAMPTEEVYKLPNRIVNMLDGQVILITGATGFMGKVLLEKILRISDVDTIYLLIRNKKGKDSRQRVEELYHSPVSLFLFCL